MPEPLTEEYAEEQLTLREHVTFAFWGLCARCDWLIRGVRCLLTRHNVAWGDYRAGEPDWCRRCWRSDPNEEQTLWYMANRLYVFLIEHSKLFERFDEWVFDSKLRRWLPSWWEY